MTIKTVIAALGLTIAWAAHAATLPPKEELPPTEADVGDVDSFGHNAVYLGVASLSYLFLASDCANIPNFPVIRAEDRCTALKPQPAVTSFNQSNMKTIKLPANASRSLLCLTITPYLFAYFENQTANAQQLKLWVDARMVVQNEVLSDPVLLNPITHQPFGGRLDVPPQSLVFEDRKLDPGEQGTSFVNQGRACDGGVISKSYLRSLGLSEAQATAFFTKPMTLSFGISGFASALEHAQLFYNARIYGDR